MSSAPRKRAPTARTLNEATAIASLRRQLCKGSRPNVLLDIGDDAAVLQTRATKLVTSIDASAEGVHFDLAWIDLSQAGARALTAAVSDLAAMGASPLAATINIEFPKSATAAEFSAIGRGQAKAAAQWSCPVVGGNLIRGQRWVFTSHVLGSATEPLTRAGARAGDELWLVGDVGLAAIGLHLLQARVNLAKLPARERRGAKSCLNAWCSPVAQVAAGLQLVRRATSLIDVSDGLVSEARHVALASGVALEIEAEAVHALAPLGVAELCEKQGISLLEKALFGGEDYALLATGPARVRPPFARSIGRVLDGTRGQVFLKRGDARREKLERGSFDHFAPRS